MGIYFGNLDRELADRQNVLKEDAARQYRGMQDVRQSFSDFGNTAADVMEEHGVPKWLGGGGVGRSDVQLEKLRYDVKRQSENDKRLEERHKDLRLSSTLKNIEGLNKINLTDHTLKQWPNGTPKAVRKLYEDRMDQMLKSNEPLDSYQKVLRYPNLYGSKAREAARRVALLIKNNGKQSDIDNARLAIPQAPLGFMSWAKEQGYFNDKIKGNPLAPGNAMYRHALAEAGYSVPNPDNYLGLAGFEAGSTSPIHLGPDSEAGVDQLDILGGSDGSGSDSSGGDGSGGDGSGSDSSSTPEILNLADQESLPANILEERKKLLKNVKLGPKTIRNEKGELVEISKEDANYINIARGASEWMNFLPSANLPTGSENYPIPPDDADQEAVEGETRYDKDGNLISVSKSDAAYLNFVQGTRRNTRNLSAGQSDNATMANAADNGNTFTVELGNTLKKAGVSTLPDVKVLTSRDEIKRPPDWGGYKEEGPETGRVTEPRFFPFMEGWSRDETIPGFKDTNSWVSLSREQKEKFSEHPMIIQGASPEKVFNYEKAREELQIKDDEILFLHNPLKHFSALKDPGSFTGSKLEIAPSKYGKGSLVGTDPQLQRQVKNYNMKMPLLQKDRKKLVTKLKNAETNMNASIQKMPTSRYEGFQGRGEPSVIGPNVKFPTRLLSPPEIEGTDVVKNKGGKTRGLTVGGNQIVDIDAGELQDIRAEGEQKIIDQEGYGIKGEGHAYYDGKTPSKDGNYGKGSENLVLAGGNNIYDTINSIPNKKDRDKALEDVAWNLFGEGKDMHDPYQPNNKLEFIHFMNMPKENHKIHYATHEQRGKLHLFRHQQAALTNYMMTNHLERLTKKHPYLDNMARYPKEMQLFIMDNAFNMGPNWLTKFKKLEGHLKNWATKGYKDSDLKLIMNEYKDSDHFRDKISSARALENWKRLETLRTS